MSMTTQETNFAKEYVFQYFNSDDKSAIVNAALAAKVAGYAMPDVSVDKPSAESVGKALLANEEIKTYIDNQIGELKAKLNPIQRRSLWAAIEGMTVGDPTDWEQHGFIKSTL